MRVLVSGASGMVGSALRSVLETAGDEVTRLGRRGGAAGEVRWDITAGTLDGAELEGHDAVVHLAGESVGSGRWTAAKKARIRDSRIDGTKLLCGRLAALERRPRVLVSASAIGFYGDRGDEVLTEESAPGSGFLPEVARDWEAETEAATAAGIRVVPLRFGVILSADGGALSRMLTPFRLGVGGVIGNGAQYMSWISLDDVVGTIIHAIQTEALAGPVNAVAPAAVTNREFTKTLGRVLGRPTIFPMPAFAARLAFGEMADALLLASARVQPDRLTETGYGFRHTALEPALRHVLGKPA